MKEKLLEVIEKLKAAQETLLGLASAEEKPTEIGRPSVDAGGKKFLWVPFANSKYKMPTKGKYAKGYPEGAVVHFTAGRSLKGDSDAEGTISWGKEQGYMYFCISSTGTIFQTAPLDSWGHHAGVSELNGRTGTSEFLVGIEICCAGRLEIKDGSFVSWFGEKYSSDLVRKGDAVDNCKAGAYHKMTIEQEKSLIQLLKFLKENNPEIFSYDNVRGHDEVAPNRKNDPGHALSMSMPQLRKMLKTMV